MEDIISRVNSILSPYFYRGSVLRKAASNNEIYSLEKLLGYQLPNDFKIALSFFNGEVVREKGTVGIGLYFNFIALTVDEIKQSYTEYIDILKGGVEFSYVDCYPKHSIQNTGFDKGWIPFASDHGGAFYALDMNPGINGVVGQVIQFSSDSSYNIQIAESYEKFLFLLLDRYQQNRHNYVFGNDDQDEFYEAYCHEHNVVY